MFSNCSCFSMCVKYQIEEAKHEEKNGYALLNENYHKNQASQQFSWPTVHEAYKSNYQHPTKTITLHMFV